MTLTIALRRMIPARGNLSAAPRKNPKNAMLFVRGRAMLSCVAV